MFLLSNEKINAKNNEDINHKTSEKNCKDKYVNMAFTDENYEFIVSESSKFNAHFTNFINFTISSASDNQIVDFITQNPIRQCKSLASKRTGEHLKRIYFKLSTENFEKIRNAAEQNNSSKTVIVNVILEIYRKKSQF